MRSWRAAAALLRSHAAHNVPSSIISIGAPCGVGRVIRKSAGWLPRNKKKKKKIKNGGGGGLRSGSEGGGRGGGGSAVTRYRTATVDGIDIFYREAGLADAPVVLLLHGFPTSSHMFRNLIPVLAHRYRVIAPDYPAFGQSGTPDRREFTIRFARFAELMDGLLSQLGVERYALYVQDYGAPVGYRLALRHPERITALVVQNGNAYEEGLKQFWNPIKAYWADGSDAHREPARGADPGRDEIPVPRRGARSVAGRTGRLAARSGAARPAWHRRDHARPVQGLRQQRRAVSAVPGILPLAPAADADRLGKNDDVIFPADGARPYLRDLPDAELHLLDTGHFALEDKGDEIASAHARLPRSEAATPVMWMISASANATGGPKRRQD